MDSRTPEDRHEEAQDLFQQAYRAQMTGDWERAAELYKASLEILPTAEAHTFLGWTYHFQGKIRDAIDECKRAIEVDPDFGNPYNDIGAYLIALGRLDEAVPWLERAIQAPTLRPAPFPAFQSRPRLSRQGNVRPGARMFSGSVADRAELRARQPRDRKPPPPRELGSARLRVHRSHDPAIEPHQRGR